MLLRDWISKKILSIVGLSKFDSNEKERLTLINDKQQIVLQKIEEANVWYEGDSDELLNYYTRATHIDWNYEPWYSRNKRGYFWSISSTESDIKRTHSGQPRNIIDTFVNLVDVPQVFAGNKEIENNQVLTVLRDILDENEFWDMYRNTQLPMTMVEGWGAYRIDWDREISDNPIIKYYRAKDCDFIYRDSRLIGMIFKEYYTDGKFHDYLICETRYNIKNKLVISKNVFKVDDSDGVYEIYDLPEGLDNISLEPQIIDNYRGLLAVPTILFKDLSNNDGYGRSMYTGKFDLFDDLDQCLSQSSNTVRRSTAIEYFNTDFLERDKKTGMPKMPKAYDRKYTMIVGGRTADGAQNTDNPVTVTQPNLQFNEYSTEAQAVLVQMISGIMSPATLGIDVAKKDNADAQREKEKVTIFTRNAIIRGETTILKNLFNAVLEAKEMMSSGQITCHKYDISIKYSEFADDSYENKLQSLSQAFINGAISTDMYIEKLYGDTLTESEKKKEHDWLEQNMEKQSDMGGMENGLGDMFADSGE